MWDQIERLHDYHHLLTVETRLLKLTEEVGEAAEAYIDATGLNLRKGVSKTRDDLLAELSDVIITAAMTMTAITNGDVTQAAHHFTSRLQIVTDRINT